MNSIRQFFHAANAQWRTLHRRNSSLLLTSRRAQTLSVVGVSAVCAVFVLMTLLSATRAREQWAQSREVIVASVDLAPGDALHTHNTQRISLPLAIVSFDALYELPPDASVRIALRAHTVLSSSLITSHSDVTAIPPGWRIVALPKSLSTPPLVVGDQVEIVGGVTVIADSAVVVTVAPLTVAVPHSVSAVVAAAARMGEISIVVSR